MNVNLLVVSAVVIGFSCASPRVFADLDSKDPQIKMVAYDAKDKRYYSVEYARAHGWHDREGDPLTVQSLASLPKNARLSHAMHGKITF